MVREEDPFKVLKHIRDNVYMSELLRDMNVSTTFNVSDLAHYMEHNFEDLRENASNKGHIDGYQVPSQLLAGPSSIPKSKPTSLGQERHKSSTALALPKQLLIGSFLDFFENLSIV